MSVCQSFRLSVRPHSKTRLVVVVVMVVVQSVLDFGPVVKPLGITVKKEAGKMVETSDVVKPPATKSFEKVGKSP